MKAFYISISGLFCIVLLYACNNKTHHDEKIIDTLIDVSNTSIKSTTDTIVLYSNTEYIDWNDVRINGVLPPIGTTKLLYKALGDQDSIVTPNVECAPFYDKAFKIAYFKGSCFELYGDTVVIRTINFKQSGITLSAGKFVLSGNTTLADIAKVFPKSVKDKSNVEIDTFGEVISISVNTGKARTEDAWSLMFKDGKLVQMDYWTPC